MAIGKKTGGRNFEPGKSGNPKGRPRLPEDIKEARALNQIELTRILNKYLYMPIEEIKRELAKPNTPALEVAVGKVLAAAINKGDQKRLDFILSRTVGSVKKVYEVTGAGGSPLLPYLSMTPDERRARIEALSKRREGKK